MDDDTIIRQRIAGRSVRAIAKAPRRAAARPRSTRSSIVGRALLSRQARKHALALELAPGSMSCNSLLRESLPASRFALAP
jgi:hypothetical protein